VFVDCDLSGASLRLARLRQCYLSDSLQDADLRGALLRSAQLCGADLRGARFENADLRRADLSRSTLDGADLCKADLRGTGLLLTTVRNAKLAGVRRDRLTQWPRHLSEEALEHRLGGVALPSRRMITPQKRRCASSPADELGASEAS
jgi:uncharacterized protein YjbI with pentapeptide repeats